MDITHTVTQHVCPKNCYSSCSMVAYTRNGKLQKVEGDKKHGYTKGKLCAKGYNYKNLVYHPERLQYPMIQSPRGSGKWKRITWSEAITIISNKIIELYERYDSHLSLALNKYSGNMGVLHHAMEGFFYGLGKTSQAVGNPCWAPGMDAFLYDFGDIRTSNIADISHAKTIIIWGMNPVWTSIHSMKYIYKAKSRGAKIITIDPVYTETAKKSDVFIQVKPRGDGALAVAIAKYLLELQLYDKEFVGKHTHGWKEMKEHLEGYSMEECLEQSGQTEDAVKFLAERLSLYRPASILVGFGMQRHENGGQNIRAINSLAAITGNIGKKGSGVQFGQHSTKNFSYKIMRNDEKSAESGSGVRAIDMNDFALDIGRQQDPPIRFLWIGSRNLMTQSANVEELKKAFDSLELIVTVDLFLTETAKYSDIVLPATSPFEEWDLSKSYWHHWISINEPAIEPYYESKSELDIARLLSKKLNDYKESFSAFPTDLSDEEFIEGEFTEELYESLQISHWRDLLDGPRKLSLPESAWDDFRFDTPSKKFELYSEEAKENGLPAVGLAFSNLTHDEDYPYTLLLSHEPFQINSQFKNLTSFKEISKEPTVYLHSDLAKEKGIKNSSLMKVFNEKGEIIIRAKVTDDVNKETLTIFPNHPLINELISFKAADMGERATGGKGSAINSLKVNVKRLN